MDLCALGLTQYEAKVYLALIRRRSSTAAEAARAATVPRQRIYDVLASLFERGLVLTRPGRSTQYAAIDPKEAVDRLISEQREALDGLERSAGDLARDLAPSWSSGQDVADPLDFVTVLRDGAPLRQSRDEMCGGARRRLLIMEKRPAGDRRGTEPTGEPAGTAAKPGYRLRSTLRDLRAVFEYDLLHEAAGAGEIALLAAQGAQVRLAQDVPMRISIADDSRVLMSLTDPLAAAESVTTLVVEHTELARFLTHAFDTVWTTAEPYDGTAPASG